MTTHKRRVLVVGGGFGGIKTALKLCQSDYYHVSLISDNPEFCYHGALYRVATGINSGQSNIPLTEIFRNKNVELIIDQASGLDRSQKKILLRSGRQLSYDRLIIAIGSQPNFFNIKGLADFALPLHSLQDAQKIKRLLHDQLVDNSSKELNCVIVGGGPAGIELAGEMGAYLRRVAIHHNLGQQKINIDLVEAAPRLVPKMPKDMSKKIRQRLRRLGITLFLGETVQAETADALMVGGKSIRSHIVIWTAGVKNQGFFTHNDFSLSDKGLVMVDRYLRAEPDIWVIGDNADTPYAGMAQTALHDAEYVADNLSRMAAGKYSKVYMPKKPVYVIPVGYHWAAILWGPFLIYGWLGWAFRRLADWEAYRNLEPWWPAGLRWLSDFTQEDCPTCATNPTLIKTK